MILHFVCFYFNSITRALSIRSANGRFTEIKQTFVDRYFIVILVLWTKYNNIINMLHNELLCHSLSSSQLKIDKFERQARVERC